MRFRHPIHIKQLMVFNRNIVDTIFSFQIFMFLLIVSFTNKFDSFINFIGNIIGLFHKKKKIINAIFAIPT